MLGFRQLQDQIKALDYCSWSAILRLLDRLQHYIGEAKARQDGPARRAAEVAVETWSEIISVLQAATDKTSSNLTAVQIGNLLRTQAALKQLRAML